LQNEDEIEEKESTYSGIFLGDEINGGSSLEDLNQFLAATLTTPI